MDLTLNATPLSLARRAALSIAPVFLLFSAIPAQAGFHYVAPTGGLSQQQYIQPVNPNMPAPVAMRGGSVQGFANAVPLPVALRQVLPRGIAYSIADNIDVNTKVNWQGGQSWQQTLEAMLAPAGLQALYTSNKVLVTRNALAPIAMTPSAPLGLKPPVDKITPLEIGNETAPVIQDTAPAMADAAPLAPLPVVEDVPVAAPEPQTQLQAQPVMVAMPVAEQRMAQPDRPEVAAPIALQPMAEPVAMAAPEPLPVVEPAPVIESVPVAAPAPQPYIASSTGPAASLMPPGSAGGNATIGAVQDAPPVVAAPATMAPLPEAQVQQQVETQAQITTDPRPAPIGNATAEVPGTEIGGIPPIVVQPAQTSVAPGDVSETAPVASSLAALDAQPVVAAAPWEAHSGQTLHETLSDWAKRAGSS